MLGVNNRMISNDHCKPVAARLNKAQINRYPDKNVKVKATGWRNPVRLRFRAENNKTMDAALGTIMATIMIHHMRKTRTAYATVHGACAIITAPTPVI
jgi:hypothetical protein